jgi:hypothetical protein
MNYQKSSPEQIRADIERTRAHIDETLAQLGRKFHPRLLRDRLRLFGMVGAAVLGIGGALFFAAYLTRSRRSPGRSPWRKAGILDQFLVAKSLIAAARKGKPAIYVVRPG